MEKEMLDIYMLLQEQLMEGQYWDEEKKLWLPKGYKEYMEVNSIGGKMEISNYTKATGTFLKAEDVKRNPMAPFIITAEGVMRKSEKFGNERLHIEGEMNKEAKIFDCSKTNARFISEKLGNDTAKWIGKQVFFEVYKTKTSDGKLVDALNVKEVK